MLDGVDLVEGAAHVVAEAHLVEDEELGLGSERCRVRDAGGLEVCLGLRGDLAGITGVRLVGERVDNREGDVERLVLAERVDEGGLDIRNELHIGFVMAWKPSMEEPSKGMPSSNASLRNSLAGTVKCC